MPTPMDKYELYEQAAQSPTMQARFLRALYGGGAEAELTLCEDFSGTGAISRAWVELYEKSRAICVDRDPAPLARLAGANERLTVVQGDVRKTGESADIICSLNFSTCELHDRAELIEYLSRVRKRLHAGGVFVCDLYAGVDSLVTGESEMELRGGVRYIWEQREANPLTGRVVNAMHFVMEDGRELRDAFVYDWRLWSPAELGDAMREVGFGKAAFHDRLGDAMDEAGELRVRAIESADELEENFVVYVVGR